MVDVVVVVVVAGCGSGGVLVVFVAECVAVAVVMMLLLLLLLVVVVVLLLFAKTDWTVLQTVQATDHAGRKHELELTLDLIYEDGPIGDNGETAYHLFAT